MMLLANLHLSQTFNTTALDIYTILTDLRRHSSFTSDIISGTDKEGATLSLHDGKLIGKTVVLEPAKKIIWSVSWVDENWPQNHPCEIAIVLADKANETCLVDVFITAIPTAFEAQLKTFWQQNYFDALAYYIDR